MRHKLFRLLLHPAPNRAPASCRVSKNSRPISTRGFGVPLANTPLYFAPHLMKCLPAFSFLILMLGWYPHGWNFPVASLSSFRESQRPNDKPPYILESLLWP